VSRARRASRAPWLLLAGLAAGLHGACAPEQRVVRYEPFLGRVPGAEGARPVIDGQVQDNAPPPTTLSGAGAAAPGESEPLVFEGPRGERVLNLRSVRHLMAQLSRAMAEDDLRIFYEQAVARQTKEHWAERSTDAEAEVLNYLWEHRGPILMLFARMPGGEQSPTVNVERAGRNQLRIRVRDVSAQGLEFTTLTVELDNGRWKLVWVN
jgi:hypothetical protein